MEAEEILMSIREMKENKNISIHFKPIIVQTEEMAELMIQFKTVEDEDKRNRIKDLIVDCRDKIEREIPVVCRSLNIPEDALDGLKNNLISQDEVYAGGPAFSEAEEVPKRAPRKQSNRSKKPNQWVNI